MTLWFMASFAVFLVLAFSVSYLALSTLLNEEMEEDLTEDIEEFQMLYEAGGLDAVVTEIEREAISSELDEEFILLIDATGQPIQSTDLSAWQGLALDQDQLTQAIEISDPVLLDAEFDRQEYTTKTILGRLDDNLFLYIGESTEERSDVLELLQIIFLAILLITIPLTAVVIRMLSNKSVAGIDEVSQAAFAIRRGELERRASVSSKDMEIQQLAETFNSMADRIRGLITEMREMIDNIAHDLRSPIARIRAISESALSSKHELSTEQYKSSIMDTLEECDRLINLINTTLDVAEAEADISNHEQKLLDFSQLVREACELYEPFAEQKSIKFTNDIAADCSVFGIQQNLQRMIINLIDNALKYTQAGGHVHVTVSNHESSILCSVRDDGMGIPDSEHEKVFQRFYRTDLSRGEQGCGLGLSYAIAVCRAHNGEIKLHSQLGAGSKFTVDLPKFCTDS